MTLYRLYYTWDNDTELRLSSDLEPFTLDDALCRARRLNTTSDRYDVGLRYFVQPVHGTEPRYRIINADPEAKGGLPFTAACCPQPLPWAEVCRLWHINRLAESKRHFVYKIVVEV